MKAAIVYWSGTGNTKAMASAVAEGAKTAGAEADVFTADEFDAARANGYDAVAFGCPAMGAEELEDSEFQPMYDAVKGGLGGKAVGLFGSYGWGGGEWMRIWEEDAKASGLALVGDGVACEGEPDENALASCKALGAALVK